MAGPCTSTDFPQRRTAAQGNRFARCASIRIHSRPSTTASDTAASTFSTKPGADRFRGNLNYNLGDDVWNARNPYSATKAPLLLNEWENTISGPLNKNTSFVAGRESK